MADARVIFSDSEVAALTALPRGQVYRYMITSGRAIARDARHNVHSRTRKLERSITARITRANATSTRVRISANTDYAVFVHEGTGGSEWSITGDGPGGWMKLYSRPDNPAGAAAAGRIAWYGAWVQEVDGQDANPFLAQALGEWCMENGFKHPLLRGPMTRF